MSGRIQPVLQFAERPPDSALRRILGLLESVFSREIALLVVPFLANAGGLTVTNAAVAPGSALGTRTLIDLADAGVDQVRVVLRGNNSTAGSVTVQIYDVTSSMVLCSVVVTGTTVTTYASSWTRYVPVGGDLELEARIVGDGAMDPVLFSVVLQGRTTHVRN